MPVTPPVSIVLADLDEFRALFDRLLELHKPVEQDAEFSWDYDTGPSAHCAPTCVSDRTCPDHTVKVKVCQECGYEHDDGYPTFRLWPCPTIKALCDFANCTPPTA